MPCFFRDTLFRSHYVRDFPRDRVAASVFEVHCRKVFISFHFLIRNLNTSEFLILISECHEFQYNAFCLFHYKNSIGHDKFEDGYLA